MPKFITRFYSSGRSFWALSDQAIVSAGNFGTSLLLARNLPASEFGVFVLLNAVYLALFGLQGNLIVAPFMVLAESGVPEKTRAQLSSALVLSFALMAPFSIVMLIASASLHRLETGWCALLYLTFWQLQETTRRALYATFRYKETIPGDFVSYIVQAGILALLFSRKRIDLDIAFLLMAATSAVAMLIQVAQMGIARVGLREIIDHGKHFWTLGKWLAVVSLTTIAVAPISTWILNFFRGETAAAIFAAVLNVVGIVHPVLLSLPGLIIPLIAVRFKPGGGGTGPWAASQALKFTLKVWLFLMPLYLFLLVLPETALRWFYGSTSIYVHQSMGLRIAVCMSIATIPLTVYNSVLTGMGLTRENASINAFGAMVAVVLTPPLAYFGGIMGALAAECTHRAARAGWAFHRLRAKTSTLDSNQFSDRPINSE